MIGQSVFRIDIWLKNIPESWFEVWKRRKVEINIFLEPYQVNTLSMLRDNILCIQ